VATVRLLGYWLLELPETDRAYNDPAYIDALAVRYRSLPGLMTLTARQSRTAPYLMAAHPCPAASGGDLGLCSVAPGGRAPSSLGLMTTAEDDPDRRNESQAEATAPAAETPTRLGQAAAGVAEAQAWKGQQIAKGWRKLVNVLRKRAEGEG
jgi:hypothetical protein